MKKERIYDYAALGLRLCTVALTSRPEEGLVVGLAAEFAKHRSIEGFGEFAERLKKRILSKDYGILNHDIQKALYRSFRRAVKEMQADNDSSAISSDSRSAIDTFLQGLIDNSENFFVKYINESGEKLFEELSNRGANKMDTDLYLFD
jgi:hypothetical protein